MIEKILKNSEKNIKSDLSEFPTLNSKDFSDIGKRNEYVKGIKEKIESEEKYPMIEKYKYKIGDFLESKSKEIDLSFEKITDEELEDLFQELSNYNGVNLLEKVKKMVLSQTKLETLTLTENMPNLLFLDLYSCYTIKKITVNNMPKLKKLNCRNCEYLTSLNLSETQNIENLDLSECRGISELILPIKIPKLKTFDLSFSNIIIDEKVWSSICSSKKLMDLRLYDIGIDFKIGEKEFDSMIFGSTKTRKTIKNALEYRNSDHDNYNGIYMIKELKETYGKHIFHKAVKYLIFEERKIVIGKKEIDLFFPKHINILSGFLATTKQISKEEGETDEKYFERVKLAYEINLFEFILKGKEQLYDIEQIKDENGFPAGKEKLTPKSDNIVFSIFAEDDFSLPEENREKSNDYFQTLGKLKNYNISEESGIKEKPEKIIEDIQTTIKENPKSQIIIKMAGHGNKDGSMDYNGTKFTKDDFAILFNLGPNVHLNITSCNSGYKDDNANYFKNKTKSLPNFADNELGSLVLDSSLQSARGGGGPDDPNYHFYDAFTKTDEKLELIADYDGNGVVSYHEAVLYRNLNYDYSITPTSFDHDNNPNTDMIEVVENGDNLENVGNKV